MSDSAAELEESGFKIERNVLPASLLSELARELERLSEGAGEAVSVQKGDAAYALRNLLGASSRIMGILRMSMLPDLLRRFVPEPLYAVRGILFDKPFRANWFVPWHQDLTIAVQERRIIQPGFARWTVKAGIHHARPPSRFLANMLTARIHLDDANESNGALRVVPGSHREGILPAAKIPELVERGAHVCAVSAGDVMFMRPLLLHSSRATTISGHRRVLHIEFSPDVLPEPVEWMWRVGV